MAAWRFTQNPTNVKVSKKCDCGSDENKSELIWICAHWREKIRLTSFHMGTQPTLSSRRI